MNATAAVDVQPAELSIDSKLLGDLVVPVEQVFAFETGILGFPDARSFALIPAERDGLFWLQSVEWPALTFLLLDPFTFVEGYTVELGPQELGALLPEDASQILVLSILTLPREQGDPATANLQGPVAFNLEQRTGRQVVIESPYGLRYPVQLVPAEE